MTKTGYCSVGGDLLNNNNVVSDITDEEKRDDHPPNKTMTLKSGPAPNITAECLHRRVMAVGRVTCRMMVTIATEFTDNY